MADTYPVRQDPLPLIKTPSLPTTGQIGMKDVLGIQEPYMKEKARLIPEISAAKGRVEEAKQAQQEIGAQGEVAATKGFAAAEKGAMQQYQGKMEREPLPAFVPSKENAEDLATLFSLVGVIGMLVGGGGKQNAQQAMSAMNGMLEGHQKGRADLYKQELSTFDKNFKSMVQKHAEFRKEMEDAVKLASTDKEGAMADAKLAAVKAGSNIVKAMLDQGRLMDSYKLVDESQTGVNEAVAAEAKIRADAAKEAAAERRHKEDLAARLQQHKETLAAKGSAKASAADRYGFGDIVAGASNEAAAAIRNLMGLPFESTSGIFGGKQTNSLFTAPLDAFANTLTSESVQRYNTQSGKLGYNLAQLMSGGRAVRVSDVDQMNKILQIKEGDTLETAASRIAEARQLAERTIEVRSKSPNTPKELKEVFKENLQTIQETVPFTVDDINKFVANRDKSITFSQALSKRYPSSESAPTPANAGPGGAGKRGGATGEAVSVDIERSRAKAAIAAGAPESAVKARFKEKTGQEL